MTNRRLVDVQELSELRGLSINTIYSWVSQRKIPFVKCGRLTKFYLKVINEEITENTLKEERFERIPK